MKVVKLNEYRGRGLSGDLRKDDYGYEYCVVSDYEELFGTFRCEAIQIGNVFANMLIAGKEKRFVSVLFPEDWSVPEIVDWLEHHVIYVGESPAGEMGEIIEGVLYRGNPIVLGKKGNRTLSFNTGSFEEVTGFYEHHHVIRNSHNYKEVDWPDKDDAIDSEYPGVSDED